MANSKLTIIKAKSDTSSISDSTNNKKRRVAAYARVSSDKEEQSTSYENQVEEWIKRIKANPDYEFVNVYTDDGISGTYSDTRRREGFNNMIEDAKNGLIDLILVKSIFRFARNTVIGIETTRELKKYGVEVYFDNEHLSSLDEKSEFIFGLLCAMAQEESRHISENVKWTLKKKMIEGDPLVNTTRFLGYDKTDDKKKLVINEAEAEIVKLIFNLYDSGLGCFKISQELMKREIKTVTGNTFWHATTVLGVLKNEKYVGDLLLQKTFVSDFLTHTKKINRENRDQYMHTDMHEAIIDREQWDRIQEKLKESRKNSLGENGDVTKFTNRYPLSGMLICANCGNTYKRRLWNSNQPCSRFVYQCGTYVQNGINDVECHSKAVSEHLAIEAACDVINKIYIENSKLFDELSKAIKAALSGDSLLAEIKRKQKLRDEIISDIKMILDNLTSTNDFEIKQKLNKKYKEANSKLNRLDNDLKYLESKQSNSLSSKDRMDEMMKILNKKKVTSNILNNEMIGVFFYRIFVVNKNELVFVINSTNSLSLDELIEKRNDIINQDSVYENVLTMPDPKKKATIKYKVVLI